MSTKRGLASPTGPNAPKKNRIDSQNSQTGDSAFTSFEGHNTIDRTRTAQFLPTPQSDTHSPPGLVSIPDDEVDGAHTPSVPIFPTNITINGQLVGQLTADKVILDATEFIGYDGDAVSVSRPGKRILRIGDTHDNVSIKLPRTPYHKIEILHTQNECRATADGEVMFQKGLALSEAEKKFHRTVVRTKAQAELMEQASRADANAPSRNEWHQMYNEWKEWTDEQLLDVEHMKRFPDLPKEVHRCKKPSCSRTLEDGKPRPLRHLKQCRCDLEMWFRDAAGGYNQNYHNILKDEEGRWQSSWFPEESHLRSMAGELWKYAVALSDQYVKTGRGFLE